MKAYVIKAKEEASTPDVVASNFTLFDDTVVVLIDPGYTYLYI